MECIIGMELLGEVGYHLCTAGTLHNSDISLLIIEVSKRMSDILVYIPILSTGSRSGASMNSSKKLEMSTN